MLEEIKKCSLLKWNLDTTEIDKVQRRIWKDFFLRLFLKRFLINKISLHNL